MKPLTDIGFISKAHGFQGEVIFVPDDHALPPGARFLFFMLEGKPVPFFLLEQKEKNGSWILKFEDVDNEADAKKLAGLRLYAETEALPETADRAWQDLIGYEVRDETAGSLGALLSVEEYPGQLVGRCEVNGREVLFPLTEELLTGLDDEKKILHIQLPDGLLSIYLSGE